MVIYRPVQYVSEITTRGNNRPVSGGRKRPHSGSPAGHLFAVKRDRDLGRLSRVGVWQEEPVVPRHSGTFCTTPEHQASNTATKHSPHNQGYLLSPVWLQNNESQWWGSHHWDKEIYRHGPDHRADKLLHLFGSVAMCEHLWKRHHAPHGVKSVRLAHAELTFEIWGTYSTENAMWRDCRLESGSCSVCSLYFSVSLCVSARASPCLWKHGYANSSACAHMNHRVCMGGVRVISHAAVNNIIQLLFFFSSRHGCILYTPSQGHDSWEITQIFAQLSSYLLLIYKQSHAAFPCTRNAAQTCNPISFFVLLLLLVDIKMHRRRIVNHQTLSQKEQLHFHMNFKVRRMHPEKPERCAR